MKLQLLFVAAAALALAGCRDGSYARAEVTAQQGDTSATLDLYSGVAIDEGAATSAHVELRAHDSDVMTGDLVSADPTVLRIAHTPTDAKRFVFLGVRAGTTRIEVTAGGERVAAVPVTVRAAAPYAEPDAGIPWASPPDAGSASDAAGD
jgi:hypothetical protein